MNATMCVSKFPEEFLQLLNYSANLFLCYKGLYNKSITVQFLLLARVYLLYCVCHHQSVNCGVTYSI